MSTHACSQRPLKNTRVVDQVGWSLAIAALAFGAAGGVSAQTSPAEQKIRTEFPADALPLAPQELQQRLEGKVYTVRLADGTGWRADYRGEYVFVNLNTGPSDKGRWRVEGSMVCAEYSRFPSGCSEIRGSANRLYLKRPRTGEVVALETVQ